MCIAIYKRLARREKNRVEERTFEATLNLAFEYYGEKKGMLGLQNLLILKALQNTTM